MLKLFGFTGWRAGAPPCVLSREKCVATYFADSYFLIRVTVLLLLRQDFSPLGLCMGIAPRLKGPWTADKPTCAQCWNRPFDSFLDFFAAFFSLVVFAGCFFFSLLLFCSLPISIAPVV